MEALPVHQHGEAPDKKRARGIDGGTSRAAELFRDRYAEKVEERDLRNRHSGFAFSTPEAEDRNLHFAASRVCPCAPLNGLVWPAAHATDHAR